MAAAALETLLAAAAMEPGAIHLAHDGQRLQPLLGLYPSSAAVRTQLAAAVGQGERRLQGWLAAWPWRPVALDPRAIRNVNRPETAQPADSLHPRPGRQP
jgi:molybdopterin-guanine dinucleotide biosynthesis protein A